MASSDNAQTGAKAALSSDFSTFPSREMPPPEPLRKMVGPGVIMVAVGVGSGEYILHPYITVQAGLVFLWAAALGVATQYFLNTEVERYTLATGESAVTGFVRMWKGWAPLFVVMTIVPWAWPGWMTSGAVLITYLTGGGNTVAIAIAGLVIMGLILTASPVVYQTVEKLEFLKVAAILVFTVVVVAFVIGVQPWVELGKGTVQGFGRLPEGIPIAVVMSALVFAGGGGTINLTMSNWIRDKGWGMGKHIPRLVSPITGHEEAAATSTGYSFPLTDENLSRWNVWWKNSRVEQFWSFLVIGVMSIVMFSVLAYSVVPQGSAEAANLDFIQLEGELLGETFGAWLKITFWFIGAMSLMFANLVIVDMVGRIVADILKNHYLANNSFWSESKLYFAVVWAEVLFGSVILLSGMDQPLVLLVTAAVLNGVVMAIYTILLIRLNRKALPEPIRVAGPRLGALVWAFILYGGFSLLTASVEIPKLFGGGS